MRRLVVALGVGVSVICLAVLGPARPSAAQGTLTGLSWSFTSLAPGTSTQVTFTFTTATQATIKSVTMTMPDGMTGSPNVVSWTAQEPTTTKSPTVTDATLSSATPPVLTLTLSQSLAAGTFNTIVVGDLTNPPSAETATSTIQTATSSAPVDSGTTPAIALGASSLTSCYTTESSTGVNDTNVSATFEETTATGANLTALTFQVPPGTGGSPSVISVSPASLTGTASLDASGTVLTYALTSSTAVAAGTPIVLSVGSLTNPNGIGSFVGEAVTVASGSSVDACEMPAVTITPYDLSALSWSSTSNTTGAAASYTYGFTTPATSSAVNLDEITLSVPPGTSATDPSLSSSTLQEPSTTKSLASPSVELTGTALDLTFTKISVPASTVVTLTFTGLTNTATAGAYASSIVGITPTQPAVGPAYSGTTSPVVNFTSTALTGLSWSVGSTAVGESDVTYDYGFQLTSAAALDTISISLPPGTGGPPSLGGVAPAAISGGTLSVSGDSATYQFAPTTIDPSTEISIELDGLTNTATTGSYAASITVFDAGSVVASGTTTSVTFTSSALTNLSWTVTPTTTSSTDATYDFGFTTASTSSLTSFVMTVPSGTGGTPAVASTSVVNGGSTITLKGTPTPTLSGTALTLSFDSTYVPSGSAVSLELTGLTNTGQAGSYTSAVTTYDKSASVDAGTTPAVALSSSSLASPTWSVSTTAISATAVTYVYGFGISVGSPIDTVTMTVPSGTAGSPTVGPVSPSALAGGSVSLSGQLLTYSLASPTTLSDGTTVSIEIDGLTNTSSAGSPTSTVTVLDDGTSIASGVTPPVTFTATVLSALSWSSDSTVAGAAGVSYTYGFTTATQTTLNGVSITLPPNTGGEPTLSSDSLDEPGIGNKTLTGTAVDVDGSTMTLSFDNISPPSGTAFTLTFSDVTNTATPGSYQASIATLYKSATVDAGTTPSLTLYAASVVLSSPSGVSWSAQLTGQDLQLVDGTPGDQSYLVDDETGTGDGWNVTVSATPFSDGTGDLTGAAFTTNGSVASAGSAAAPTATCISSCGALPTNSVTYPVAIPTDGSSQAVIYTAAAGTGSGSFEIGGASSADPVGWWLTVPANANAGDYTSTIVFSVSSGP